MLNNSGLFLLCLAVFSKLFVHNVSGKASDQGVSNKKGVYSLELLSDFYSYVNNHDKTYTFVKYYTNWCHHCKKLKPVFESLSENYVPFSDYYAALSSDTESLRFPELFGIPLLDVSSTSPPNVSFMAIECEMWGSYHMCSRLPGYPVLELITPLDPVTEKLLLEDQALQEQVAHEYYQSLGMWKRKLHDLKHYWLDDARNKEDLDDLEYIMRKHEFDGRRNFGAIQAWLDKTILEDMVKNVEAKVLAGDCSATGNHDAACEAGLDWFSKLKDSQKALLAEKDQLTAVLNQTGEDSTETTTIDENTLRTLKFKLSLIEDYLHTKKTLPVQDEL